MNDKINEFFRKLLFLPEQGSTYAQTRWIGFTTS